MDKYLSYLSARIKEKSSQGGVAMIAGGILILIAAPLTKLIAYAAIGYGAYQLLTKD